MMENIRHINVSIAPKTIKTGAAELLKELRPTWKIESLRVETFSEGINNYMFCCHVDHAPNDKIVLRIYGKGTELYINREKENHVMCLLHQAGCGPKLNCTFNNGICYDYVDGKCLDTASVRNDVISSLIAKAMAALHSLKLPEVWTEYNRGKMLTELREWISLVNDGQLEKITRGSRWNLPLRNRQDVLNEARMLTEHLERLESPLALCHTDLVPDNIIYSPDECSITFIDLEYADYKWIAFDIATHFNEFGAEHLDFCDTYPDRDFQIKWLRQYLQYKRSLDSTVDISDEEVERLYVHVAKFSLFSHFVNAMWGLVQAQHSEIDYDYVQYAGLRFTQYFARKEEALAMAA